MEPVLLRPEEAAVVLRLSRSKVYEMVTAGVLPSVRMGSTIRIPADALRQWVEQHTSLPRGPSLPGVSDESHGAASDESMS